MVFGSNGLPSIVAAWHVAFALDNPREMSTTTSQHAEVRAIILYILSPNPLLSDAFQICLVWLVETIGLIWARLKIRSRRQATPEGLMTSQILSA